MALYLLITEDPILANPIRPPSTGIAAWVDAGTFFGDNVDADNVGVGTGESYRDKTPGPPLVLHFRTLLRGSPAWLEIDTDPDEIDITVLASAGVYDAMVSLDPDAQVVSNVYPTLTAAVAAGHNSIYIEDGIYNEPGDIELLADTYIRGESKDGAKLDFGGTGHIIADGSGLVYSAGTIDLVQGDVVVTGNATAWITAGVAAGNFIVIDGIGYPILSVGAEDELTLTNNYYGPTRAAVSYYIMSVLAGVQISGLTIRDTDTYGIQLIQVVDARITDVIMIDSGVELDRTIDVTLRGCVTTGTDAGVILTRPGFHVTNAAGDVRIEGCVFRSPHGEGVLCDGNSNKITILGCAVWHSELAGYSIHSSVDSVTFDGASATQCEGNGFTIQGSNCSLSSCAADGCQHGFAVESVVMVGCTSVNNTVDGILVGAGSVGCVVTGNRSTSNGDDGVEILAGATATSVTGNVLAGNGGASLVDGGAGTVTAGNVV